MQDNIVYLNSVNHVILFYFATMKNSARKQRLILLSILVVLLYTFPFLSITNKHLLVKGFPLFYIYIFVSWCIIIFVLYKLADKRKNKTDE